MKKVLYDFMKLQDDRADLVDGSDELLREDERVTVEDLAHELAGALRRVQVARKSLAPEKPEAE